MAKSKNIIPIGSSGVGNTHIATELGIEAITHDKDVIFTTTQRMNENFLIRIYVSGLDMWKFISRFNAKCVFSESVAAEKTTASLNW